MRILFSIMLVSLIAAIFPVIANAEPVFDERTADHIDLAGFPASDFSVKKLALGDLNKDGKEDIVVARRSGEPVLLINVAGVLTQQTAMMASTASASFAYDVELIDVDNDTWPDMVFGRLSQKPSLYMNLGEDGGNNWLGFDSGTVLNMGASNSTMVEAGKIDADQFTDLVTITSNGSRRLLINDGAGSFNDETTARFGSGVLNDIGKIQLGDVDNDNDIDIIGIFGSEDDQTIAYNDGTGNFANAEIQFLNLANLTYMPVGADFNGDDIFDYRVYADNFSPTAFMSDGTFTGVFPDYQRRFDADMLGDNGKHGFAHIRDVDGDGDPDYIMSSIEMLGTSLSPDPRNEWNEMVITAGVFSGNFDVFADPEWRTEESYDVLFVDINNDSNIDLFIAHEGRYAAYINDAPAQVVEILGFNPVLMEKDITSQMSVIVSGGSNPTFQWTLGDGGSTSSGSDPFLDYAYAEPGRYQVTVSVTDAAGSDQISFWQIVHAPLQSGKTRGSTSIVYENRATLSDRVWNVNPDNNSVTAIDVDTNLFDQEVAVGLEPASLTFVGSDELWVTNKVGGDISIVDPATGQVTATVTDLPYGSKPHGIVSSRNSQYVFVALEATGTVVKIDAVTRLIVGTVAVSDMPRHLAMNTGDSSLYVSRFITPPVPGESTTSVSTSGGGEVRVIDPVNMSVLDTIILPYNDQLDTSDSSRGVPNYVTGVALSPDGVTAVVPSNISNIYRGVFRDGNAREHDQLVRSLLARIDVPTAQEDVLKRIDFDDNSAPSAAVFGPTGNHLFVIHEGSRALHILDVYANQIIVTRTAGITPRGVVLAPDGRTIYVHNYLDRSVTVFDAADLMDGVENSITETTVINTVVLESLDPQILQGKKFFFDAADSRLSSQAYLSCTGCHDEAAHDGRTWDFSDGGEGLRNTIDLRGRSGTGHGNVHWTANFDEIHDFENDIRGVFDGTGLMTDPDFALTSDTLGMPKAGMSTDLDAMAAYTATLDSVGNSPHRTDTGQLTTEALAGKELYRTSNCTSCHMRVEFTDSTLSFFHNVGSVDADTGGRLGQPLVNGGLDTPTLRGLWHGAPYLHDGSAATLQEAVLAHTDQATVGFDVTSLTTDELDDLVAYLLQIDDNESWAPHPDDNYPPDVINPGSLQNNLGDVISVQIFASDLEATTLSYSAQNLPDGLTINSVTGVIDGTALAAGDNTVEVTVSDAGGGQSTVQFGWLIVGDTDSDGLLDHLDNCSLVSNADQLDTDGDGFGNPCDGDFNNDCAVNFFDYSMLQAAFLQTGVLDTDITGDGVVNFFDVSAFIPMFLQVPGPSGLSQLCD